MSSFATYDFDSDATFAQGLASILSRMSQQNQTSDAIEAAVNDAKRFYFAKYIAPTTVDQAPAPSTGNNDPSHPHSETMMTESIATSGENVSSPAQAAYPKSFAEICAMVARGEEIPGIRLIPTTVHDPSLASKPVVPRRLKPWEVAREQAEQVGMDSIAFHHLSENTTSVVPLQLL
ncbi:hypothetical protein CcCBS67573_g07775 [Chytriomyces confervae]|uniref:Uncharacterized protein n=1 Tax=Chytriomyces confervae TaxID=246404 RepID=A0A507ES11_9FUNG|nr:hypothetical protein CcCBS67573_g07775 [Chytriomyces confervae]